MAHSIDARDPGDADGLKAGVPADRIDVNAANAKATAAGGRGASFRELTGKETKQQAAVIVDGGTLSNFPV